MFSNVPTGESNGLAAAGHDRSPYGAQAPDADSVLRTPDSGPQRKKFGGA